MSSEDISRRGFVGLGVAGLAAAASSCANEEGQIVETDVEIKTPDGMCDAAFIHPGSSRHAAVILWPDAFGLRQSM
jgi:carboxymethylenebutenolidase